MNSSSGGGRAFAVSMSSVTPKQRRDRFIRSPCRCRFNVTFSSVSPHLRHLSFYSSSFSSSSGSAPWRPPPSAAASPWSSRCHRSSGWGSPEERRLGLLLWSLEEFRPKCDNCSGREVTEEEEEEEAHHFSLCSQEGDIRPAGRWWRREEKIHYHSLPGFSQHL